MLIRYKPSILSVERGINSEIDAIATSRIHINDTSLIWFELFDHKFKRYTLEEARPYVQFRVAHIHKKMITSSGEIPNGAD